MNQELHELLAMLMAAASRVERDYFQLPIAGGDSLYRERVYCYELYHQMRAAWGHFPFSLGGEIDKSGHPLFRDGPYAQAKPDFLVHSPGDMLRNLACVEVKPVVASSRSLREDVEKLSWFRDNADYFSGVLLIYGDGGAPEHQQRRMIEITAGIDRRSLLFLYHSAVDEEAQLLAV